jgi:hypothetical protein
MADRSASFSRYLQRWWERQHDEADDAADAEESPIAGRDPQTIAAEFRKDAQFEISQARFLLRRPNAENAAEVVRTLVPAPSPTDTETLIAAIVRAGATAQRVRVTTAASAGLTVTALVVRSILRRR